MQMRLYREGKILSQLHFVLATHIMKPYPGHKPGASSPERIFNYRLSRARRITENVFGILSSKFRVLLTPIALHPDKVESAVLSCIYLHNFLCRNSVSRIFMHHQVHLIHKTQMGTLFWDYGDQKWITHIL